MEWEDNLPTVSVFHLHVAAAPVDFDEPESL
jgi:hypothetical protein